MNIENINFNVFYQLFLFVITIVFAILFWQIFKLSKHYRIKKIKSEIYHHNKNEFSYILKKYIKRTAILMSVLLIIFSFISINTLNPKLFFTGLKLTLFTFLMVYLLVYFYRYLYYKKILNSLYRVHEIMFWQSKLNMPMDKVLAYASMAVEPPLKDVILDLQATYKLKRDVPKKLSLIRDKFPLDEIHAFTYVLEERFKTGLSENFHRSSLDVLKRLRIKELKLKKMQALYELSIYIFILFVLFIVIIGLPMIIDAYTQFVLILH